MVSCLVMVILCRWFWREEKFKLDNVENSFNPLMAGGNKKVTHT